MNFTFINSKYTPRPPMPYPMQMRVIAPPVQNIQPVVEPVKAIEDPSTKKVMLWGEPTWFLFHTIPEKLKPERFQKVKRDLVNIIIMICNNLPCPICAKHATEFMSRVNFNNIHSCDDLRSLFFRFHNEVNIRKGYPLFLEQDVQPKYQAAITNNIFTNFILAFDKKNRSMRLMSDDMYRGRIVEVIKKWLADNRQHFID